MANKQHGTGGVFAATVLILWTSIVCCFSQLPPDSVPLFQSAVFYNMDLDISPGSTMTLGGPVFCNGNIWCYPGGQVTFDDSVEVSGNYFFHWDTNGDQDNNIAEPAKSPIFDHGLPISGIAPLMYFAAGATNFEALLDLPPPEVRAPQPIAYFHTNQMYFFNAASLIVSNASYGISGGAPWSNNFTVYFQDPISSYFAPSNWVRLTNDFYVISNNYLGVGTLFSTNYVPNFQFTNDVSSIQWMNNPIGTNSVWYAGFSFLTNTVFYDYRESATAQVVQVDVGGLGAWITNTAPNGGSNWNHGLWLDTGLGINSIYVYNAAPFIGRHQLPAVSLVNGQQLPRSTNNIDGTNRVTSGLTVVTPQPLYVIANYNVEIGGGTNVAGTARTAGTYPAGLFADAITVLSTNWLTNWGLASYASRPAVNTTINAACLCGIVPSTGGFDGSNARYSGGIENYFRLLENWSGFTLTYNGSMAAMFPSVFATNYWQLPANYYGIPTRQFAYNTNFNTLQDLPPLTPYIINSNAAPTLVAQPANALVLAGQTTNFTITASGVPAISYQWFFHGTNILGATNDVLLLSDIGLINAGFYAVEVSNVLGAVTSSNVLLSVYASAAPALNALSYSPASGAQFSVAGVPGYNYTVEASTNLIDWVPLLNGNSPFIFSDTNAGLPQRYYRGVYAP